MPGSESGARPAQGTYTLRNLSRALELGELSDGDPFCPAGTVMITDWRECKVALRAVGIKQVDLATFSLSLSSNDIVKACGIQERGNSLRITRYVKFSVIGVPFYSNRMAKAIKGGWNSQYKYSIGWSAVCKKDSGSPRPPHNSGRQAGTRARMRTLHTPRCPTPRANRLRVDWRAPACGVLDPNIFTPAPPDAGLAASSRAGLVRAACRRSCRQCGAPTEHRGQGYSASKGRGPVSAGGSGCRWPYGLAVSDGVLNVTGLTFSPPPHGSSHDKRTCLAAGAYHADDTRVTVLRSRFESTVSTS